MVDWGRMSTQFEGEGCPSYAVTPERHVPEMIDVRMEIHFIRRVRKNGLTEWARSQRIDVDERIQARLNSALSSAY